MLIGIKRSFITSQIEMINLQNRMQIDAELRLYGIAILWGEGCSRASSRGGTFLQVPTIVTLYRTAVITKYTRHQSTLQKVREHFREVSSS